MVRVLIAELVGWPILHAHLIAQGIDSPLGELPIAVVLLAWSAFLLVVALSVRPLLGAGVMVLGMLALGWLDEPLGWWLVWASDKWGWPSQVQVLEEIIRGNDDCYFDRSGVVQCAVHLQSQLDDWAFLGVPLTAGLVLLLHPNEKVPSSQAVDGRPRWRVLWIVVGLLAPAAVAIWSLGDRVFREGRGRLPFKVLPPTVAICIAVCGWIGWVGAIRRWPRFVYLGMPFVVLTLSAPWIWPTHWFWYGLLMVPWGVLAALLAEQFVLLSRRGTTAA